MFGQKTGKYSDVEYWEQPERSGWLMKQGDGAVSSAMGMFCVDMCGWGGDRGTKQV